MAELTHLNHLDIHKMAQSAQTASGQVRAGVFSRLMQDVVASGADQPVTWSIQTQTRQALGEQKAQVWLTLQAKAQLPLTCQSCLEPVEVDVGVEREFRFVPTEEQALLEDEESDEDVLANAHDVDVYALVEDELILGLPLGPRHGGCISAYQVSDEELAVEQEAARPNPFAALAALKKAP